MTQTSFDRFDDEQNSTEDSETDDSTELPGPDSIGEYWSRAGETVRYDGYHDPGKTDELLGYIADSSAEFFVIELHGTDPIVRACADLVESDRAGKSLAMVTVGNEHIDAPIIDSETMQLESGRIASITPVREADDPGDTFEGPTSSRPVPDEERADLPDGVDEREIVGTPISASDWDHIPEERPETDLERDEFNKAMAWIQARGDSTERVREKIERWDAESYRPGQGSALDRVNATRRKMQARGVSDWSTEEIEMTLYQLGHLVTLLEIRGDRAGTNCKRLASKGEYLHQDLIGELQNRDHWTAKDSQYLTNQFGNVMSQVKRASTPTYVAENCYFEAVRDLVAVDVLASDEPGGDEGDTSNAGAADEGKEVATDGGEVVEADTDDLPSNETVRIVTWISGVMSTPGIVEGETSGTGKTISAPASSHSDKTVRLDTGEILSGGSEFRDSRGYEIYTPGRFRSQQRSNHAPGPQAGANEVSDPDGLPEPTHWPANDEAEWVPDECAECGSTAPMQMMGSNAARCEGCGETITEDDDEQDDQPEDTGPDKWDLSNYGRGDVLALDAYAGRWVVVNHSRTQFGDVLALDVVNDHDDVMRLRKFNGMGPTRFHAKEGTIEGGQFREAGGRSVMVNVDEMDDVQDFEKVGEDEERLREYIREVYYERPSDDDEDDDEGGRLIADGGREMAHNPRSTSAQDVADREGVSRAFVVRWVVKATHECLFEDSLPLHLDADLEGVRP